MYVFETGFFRFMQINSAMEACVWPGDFGLPSVELESLQFLAFLKMCPCQVNVEKLRNPRNVQKVPLFRDGDKVFTEFASFAEYMKNKLPVRLSRKLGTALRPLVVLKGIALDMQAEDWKKGEILSYQTLLQERFYPAYLYAVWMDNANFNTVTNRWYGRTVAFPHSLYYAAHRRRSAVGFLRELYPGSLVTEEDIQFSTTRQAVTCLNMLSTKLGEKKFFYGDRPTSLDALVFGYLAPLLKLPLPNDRLQIHLKGCPNLVRFVESIIRIYLPLSDEELSMQRKEMEEWERRKTEAQSELRKSRHDAAKEKEEEVDEFKLRDQIVFAVGAVVLSVLAAIHFGLIKVEIREVDPHDSSSPQLPPDLDFETL